MAEQPEQKSREVFTFSLLKDQYQEQLDILKHILQKTGAKN